MVMSTEGSDHESWVLKAEAERHRGGDGRSEVLRLDLGLEEIASSSLASYNTITFPTWAVRNKINRTKIRNKRFYYEFVVKETSNYLCMME